MLIKANFLFLATAAVAMSSKDPHYLDGRDTMVHLFEWKWSDIADECENFLAPGGFGGVQISPPNENLVIANRPWWERYQPVSYKLVSRSGDEAAFRDMVRRCNALGVRIYVDAIFNHMSAASGIGTGGNSADYDHKNWPAVPYTQENFHTPVCAIENYQDAIQVRNCQLNGLADLNQTVEDTRSKIVAYMNNLVDIGVAGFRIDAAKHMWPKDLENIYSRLKNLNTSHGFDENVSPFIFQEVIDYGGEAVSAGEYTGFGRVTEFKFGLELSRAFGGDTSLNFLSSWDEDWGLLNSGDAFVFIDDHDTQRTGPVLTYKNSTLYKTAIAFMLAHPYGTPRIISSYSFTNADAGPPADDEGNIISPIFYSNKTCGNGYVCEHRWSPICNMVEYRNAVKGTGMKNWWDSGGNQIAFCRGELGFVAFNLESWDLNQTLHTCLSAGTYCDVISGGLVDGTCTGKTVHVGADRTANIEILASQDQRVLAIHANVSRVSSMEMNLLLAK